MECDTLIYSHDTRYKYCREFLCTRAYHICYISAHLHMLHMYNRCGDNRSRDGRGGKPGRNRWCATTGPPQTLRRQAQRLSRFGGRATRSGRLDAEEVVVGGAVGGKLDGTCRGRPAMSAAAPGPVVPAQRGVPCAAAMQMARASSAM
jgi:hypothetical protein